MFARALADQILCIALAECYRGGEGRQRSDQRCHESDTDQAERHRGRAREHRLVRCQSQDHNRSSGRERDPPLPAPEHGCRV